jgi:hypothetical protein
LWPDQEQVDVVLVDVGGHLADPLRRVGVEDDAAVVAELPISGISLMVPISLLAHMIVTRMVSSRMASSTCSR